MPLTNDGSLFGQNVPGQPSTRSSLSPQNDPAHPSTSMPLYDDSHRHPVTRGTLVEQSEVESALRKQWQDAIHRQWQEVYFQKGQKKVYSSETMKAWLQQGSVCINLHL